VLGLVGVVAILRMPVRSVGVMRRSTQVRPGHGSRDRSGRQISDVATTAGHCQEVWRQPGHSRSPRGLRTNLALGGRRQALLPAAAWRRAGADAQRGRRSRPSHRPPSRLTPPRYVRSRRCAHGESVSELRRRLQVPRATRPTLTSHHLADHLNLYFSRCHRDPLGAKKGSARCEEGIR